MPIDLTKEDSSEAHDTDEHAREKMRPNPSPGVDAILSDPQPHVTKKRPKRNKLLKDVPGLESLLQRYVPWEPGQHPSRSSGDDAHSETESEAARWLIEVDRNLDRSLRVDFGDDMACEDWVVGETINQVTEMDADLNDTDSADFSDTNSAESEDADSNDADLSDSDSIGADGHPGDNEESENAEPRDQDSTFFPLIFGTRVTTSSNRS